MEKNRTKTFYRGITDHASLCRKAQMRSNITNLSTMHRQTGKPGTPIGQTPSGPAEQDREINTEPAPGNPITGSLSMPWKRSTKTVRPHMVLYSRQTFVRAA